MRLGVVLGVVVSLAIGASAGEAQGGRAARVRRGPRAIVDVNVAGADELARVPGMGRRLAEAVVESRDREGAFACAAQLLRVKGIGTVKAPALARYLVFPRAGDGPGESLDPWQPGGERPSRPVDLNVAHAGELAGLPGMGWGLAYRVVAERERNGAFRTMEDLHYVPGVTRELLGAWRAYLYVESAR